MTPLTPSRVLVSRLRDLDPAGTAVAPLVDVRFREDDLGRILGSPTLPYAAAGRAPRSGRRPLRFTAAVAAAAAALLLAVSFFGPRRTLAPSFAATPRPLVYSLAAATREPARARLLRIARTTAALPVPAGRFQHLVTDAWSLSTAVSGGSAASAVVPGHSDLWRNPDGSATLTSWSAAPLFDSAAQRRAWLAKGLSLAAGKPSTSRESRSELMYPTEPPTTAHAMAAYLAVGHPASTGPAETIVAVNDLLLERALNPRQRAAVLEALATLPGLHYSGRTTDRAGRPGTAFSLDSAYSGLPTRYTLILEPSSGQVLDTEEMLTRSAGRLNVRIPAVTDYTVYRLSAFAARGPR